LNPVRYVANHRECRGSGVEGKDRVPSVECRGEATRPFLTEANRENGVSFEIHLCSLRCLLLKSLLSLIAPTPIVTGHSFLVRSLATGGCSRYPVTMLNYPPALTSDELRQRLRPFCEKHPIRRLEVFGSVARGQAAPGSDVDLLVTLDESAPVSTADLLEMAGEAEELVGRPVDFVLRSSLEKSPNRYAREHILASAVCLYGN